MQLNENNYYTGEADMEYWSASQYKDFAGTYGRVGCEFRAMKKLKGQWKEDPSDALLIGSYVDAYFDGVNEFYTFRAGHPELFKPSGELYQKYQIAEKMIDRVKRCRKMVQMLSGEHQVIMTGEMFGVKWKIKMDSYFPGKSIVDLKTTEKADRAHYIKDLGYPVSFVQYWGYDIQGAVYQEIVRQNTGMRLPFFIAAVDKQRHPTVLLGRVPQYLLDDALGKIEADMPHLIRVKNGLESPSECGICNCCRDFYDPKEPIDLDMLRLSF